MGFYKDRIVPYLVHLSMKNREATRYRHKVVPEARGRVLELGIGSGLNLPFYSSGVASVTGVDPAERLLAMARKAAQDAPFPIELVPGSAEALPFVEARFDCVITTWSLCSIPDATRALREARRVLAPDGRLLFIEHGLAEEPGVAAWQSRLNPLWHRLSGGCNMNRRIDALIRAADFEITQIETGHLIKGPRLLTYHYHGQARPAS